MPSLLYTSLAPIVVQDVLIAIILRVNRGLRPDWSRFEIAIKVYKTFTRRIIAWLPKASAIGSPVGSSIASRNK